MPHRPRDRHVCGRGDERKAAKKGQAIPERNKKGSASQSLPAHPLITFSTDTPKLTAVTPCPPARPTGAPGEGSSMRSTAHPRHLHHCSREQTPTLAGRWKCAGCSIVTPLTGWDKTKQPPHSTLNTARTGQRGELCAGRAPCGELGCPEHRRRRRCKMLSLSTLKFNKM